MNKKIQLHKERLEKMLQLINSQQSIEECYDFDPEYIKQKEEEMIEEYSAELAALIQLSFKQIALYQNNAKPLGTFVINQKGVAEPAY